MGKSRKEKKQRIIKPSKLFTESNYRDFDDKILEFNDYYWLSDSDYYYERNYYEESYASRLEKLDYYKQKSYSIFSREIDYIDSESDSERESDDDSDFDLFRNCEYYKNSDSKIELMKILFQHFSKIVYNYVEKLESLHKDCTHIPIYNNRHKIQNWYCEKLMYDVNLIELNYYDMTNKLNKSIKIYTEEHVDISWFYDRISHIRKIQNKNLIDFVDYLKLYIDVSIIYDVLDEFIQFLNGLDHNITHLFINKQGELVFETVKQVASIDKYILNHVVKDFIIN